MTATRSRRKGVAGKTQLRKKKQRKAKQQNVKRAAHGG
jgi:hypothetical protein